MLKWIATSALFMSLAATAFGGPTKPVSITTDTINVTLKCDHVREEGNTGYDCWLSDVEDKAKAFAESKGGKYYSHAITNAPEGFSTGKYRRMNDLQVEVVYFK